MIKIINTNICQFHKELDNKKLFLFGAGRRAAALYKELGLAGKITAVIDNNEQLWAAGLCLGGENISVIGVDLFIKQIADNNISEILLLITPRFYAWKIIEQLDGILELDHLRCYIGDLLINQYKKRKFNFANGIQKIPKKIHYCWFGGKEIPLHLRKYIDTWKEKCPGYEIIRWDESNYDVSKNRYMREAYECEKWGFVPDYARLDIIYREGGIYLDTDIELLTSLDRLLCDDMFCVAENDIAINFGSGFGAVQGYSLIEKLRDAYDDKSFYNKDGSTNLMPCYTYQNPVLKEFGFDIRNEYQMIGGVVVYPSEVAICARMEWLQNSLTENTIMKHHSEMSWISDEERTSMEEYRKHIINRIV